MTRLQRWIVVRKRPSAPSFRLFCYPFAGGGASVYRRWHEHLPAEVEVVALQPPGRESRFAEPLVDRLPRVISELADAVAGKLDLPFALFGHSLGGLVAFELARELRRRSLAAPRLLIVSGRRAPHLPLSHEPIHSLPHDEFIAKLREFEGTPEAVLQHDELLELVLPILRADFAVSETYVYVDEPPLGMPLVSVGGADDADIPVDDVHAWRVTTSAHHESRIFPGGHFYFMDDPGPLLGEVRRHLERVLVTGR